MGTRKISLGTTDMPGEHKLDILIKTMKPTLRKDKFVFCTVDAGVRKRLSIHSVCEFREDEGITVILPKKEAEKAGLEFEFVCRMITLSVHSSLDAVGFLAAITQTLAEHAISVNVVSAYYHDHLFVPEDKADAAMKILIEWTRK